MADLNPFSKVLQKLAGRAKEREIFKVLLLFLFLECLEKKKLTLQEALDLFQYLPSEISDLLTDDFSDEEAPANKSDGIFVRFLR
ncbi:hypothetical protein TNCV_3231211 [Trichonephila clavipes]|nr:hypothetical protein TNCV_3231211 [Trichonephila clavipes]